MRLDLKVLCGIHSESLSGYKFRALGFGVSGVVLGARLGFRD